MNIILLLIVLFLILFLILKKTNSSQRETFVNYTKCSKLPVSKRVLEVLGKNNLQKNKNWELFLPCGYTHIEKELKTLPYLEQNFLTAMFSGVWLANKDADDNYFIDRDGTNFGYILNYIRDQQYESVIKTLDIKTKQSLLVEANYYRITELIKILEKAVYTNEALVQKRIKIYWEKEKKWFSGKIYKYCKYDQKHFIRYDDGDEKAYNLENKNWELIS